MQKDERFPELSRTITAREYDNVVQTALGEGLENRVFLQERTSGDKRYVPEWDF